MMEFAREFMCPSLSDEIMPLAVEHFKEVDPFTDKKQCTDVRNYENASDLIRIFTARINGQLVGYAAFIVSKHQHYTDSLQAQQDAIYLSPAARKGPAGIAFMVWCDKALADEGVEIIYQGSSHKRDIGPVLKRLGYEPIETLYARRVTA